MRSHFPCTDHVTVRPCHCAEQQAQPCRSVQRGLAHVFVERASISHLTSLIRTKSQMSLAAPSCCLSVRLEEKLGLSLSGPFRRPCVGFQNAIDGLTSTSSCCISSLMPRKACWLGCQIAIAQRWCSPFISYARILMSFSIQRTCARAVHWSVALPPCQWGSPSFGRFPVPLNG